MIRFGLAFVSLCAAGVYAFAFFAAAADFRFRGSPEHEAWQCSEARRTMWVAGPVSAAFVIASMLVLRWRRTHA